MDSEFSGGAHDADSEQLFFKEHTRNASKGSNTSNIARRKPGSQAANRPETKVWHYSVRLSVLKCIPTDDGIASRFSIAPRRTLHVLSTSFPAVQMQARSISNLSKLMAPAILIQVRSSRTWTAHGQSKNVWNIC